MSIRVMSEFFGLQLGSANRKMVALRLADFADDNGCGIWPTVGRIAAECEISESTVQRVLKDFVAEGILVVVKQGGGGRGSSTRYDFDLARTRVRAAEIAGTGTDGGGKVDGAGDAAADAVAIGCHDDTLETGDGKGVTDAPKGVTDEVLGCHRDTRTIMEPSYPPVERERARADDGEGEPDPETAAAPAATAPTDDPAKFERRVKRLAAEHDWPGWANSSTDWAVKQFAKLTAAERAEAEAHAGRYRQLTGAKSLSIGTYFAERKWADLPPAADEAPSDTIAPPFGPAWAGLRASLLLGTAPEAGPPVPPGSFIAMRLAQDDAAGRTARMERQAAFGWPRVNRMHEMAENRRGATIAATRIAEVERLAGFCEPVPVGSALFERWKAEHAARGWPWIPDPGAMRVVYFPAGGPERLDDFETVMRGGEAGERDCATGTPASKASDAA